MKLNGTEVPATARQIDHWVRKGWLRPENPMPGQGRAVRWSPTQARRAEVMARLVAAGVSPATASLVAHFGTDHCQCEVAPGVRIDVCLPCANRQPCTRHQTTEPGGTRHTDGRDR